MIKIIIEEMEQGNLTSILSVKLSHDGHGRGGRLMHRIYDLLGGARIRHQIGELLYEAVRGRMGHSFDIPDTVQTIGYAMRALELLRDREQRGALHFWLGQLHTMRCYLRKREQKRELHLAHSHFVQAEQAGIVEAPPCGELVWQMLGLESSCSLDEEPLEGAIEPEAPIDIGRVSLATPYLEQGRLALQMRDLAQAQAAFARARELAPLEFRCEDRWIVATLLIAAQKATETGSRHWARQCLRDTVYFYQPMVGSTEAKSWSKMIKIIADQGNLLEELADTYREIAEQQLSEWLGHFIPEEMEGPEKIPPRLLASFENAWLHYGFALGSAYTTVERALDHTIDIAQKLTSLHWHAGEAMAAAHVAEQMLTYLPQRKEEAISYFRSVLEHTAQYALVGLVKISK